MNKNSTGTHFVPSCKERDTSNQRKAMTATVISHISIKYCSYHPQSISIEMPISTTTYAHYFPLGHRNTCTWFLYFNTGQDPLDCTNVDASGAKTRTAGQRIHSVNKHFLKRDNEAVNKWFPETRRQNSTYQSVITWEPVICSLRHNSNGERPNENIWHM